MKKCEHEHLVISRDISINHTSDLSQFKNKYDEVEIIFNWDETYEWDLFEATKIEVFCRDCKRKWKNKEKFPKWLEDVLDGEENYFEGK